MTEGGEAHKEVVHRGNLGAMVGSRHRSGGHESSTDITLHMAHLASYVLTTRITIIVSCTIFSIHPPPLSSIFSPQQPALRVASEAPGRSLPWALIPGSPMAAMVHPVMRCGRCTSLDLFNVPTIWPVWMAWNARGSMHWSKALDYRLSKAANAFRSFSLREKWWQSVALFGLGIGSGGWEID